MPVSESMSGTMLHPGLWEQGVRVAPARAPPEVAEWVIEPCDNDPFPDYDTEPVMMYANG